MKKYICKFLFKDHSGSSIGRQIVVNALSADRAYTQSKRDMQWLIIRAKNEGFELELLSVRGVV